METQLCVCRAIVWLRKRPTKDHVHDRCHRSNQFELSKSNEERRISKWNRIVHKLLYPRVSELEKKWTTVYSELVNGIEPIDGRWFIQRTNRQIHQVLEMAENEKGKQRGNFTCLFQHALQRSWMLVYILRINLRLFKLNTQFAWQTLTPLNSSNHLKSFKALNLKMF